MTKYEALEKNAVSEPECRDLRISSRARSVEGPDTGDGGGESVLWNKVRVSPLEFD
jgi:hypothetical protein